MFDACQGLFPTKLPSVESTAAAPLPQICQLAGPKPPMDKLCLKQSEGLERNGGERNRVCFCKQPHLHPIGLRDANQNIVGV